MFSLTGHSHGFKSNKPRTKRFGAKWKKTYSEKKLEMRWSLGEDKKVLEFQITSKKKEKKKIKENLENKHLNEPVEQIWRYGEDFVKSCGSKHKNLSASKKRLPPSALPLHCPRTAPC